MKDDKQKLIDIMFEVGITIHSHNWFEDKTNEDVANWIIEKLDKCGFKTVPMGISWAVLKEDV